MKLFMILGGLIGFAIGVSAGLAQDRAWPDILWRASVAALLAGVVLRWWGRVWVTCFRDSLRERAVQAKAPHAASPPGQLKA
jgi:hypothetical protein